MKYQIDDILVWQTRLFSQNQLQLVIGYDTKGMNDYYVLWDLERGIENREPCAQADFGASWSKL